MEIIRVKATCMGHHLMDEITFSILEVVQYGYGDSSTDSSVDDLI